MAPNPLQLLIQESCLSGNKELMDATCFVLEKWEVQKAESWSGQLRAQPGLLFSLT